MPTYTGVIKFVQTIDTGYNFKFKIKYWIDVAEKIGEGK